MADAADITVTGGRRRWRRRGAVGVDCASFTALCQHEEAESKVFFLSRRDVAVKTGTLDPLPLRPRLVIISVFFMV